MVFRRLVARLTKRSKTSKGKSKRHPSADILEDNNVAFGLESDVQGSSDPEKTPCILCQGTGASSACMPTVSLHLVYQSAIAKQSQVNEDDIHSGVKPANYKFRKIEQPPFNYKEEMKQSLWKRLDGLQAEHNINLYQAIPKLIMEVLDSCIRDLRSIVETGRLLLSREV